MQPYHGKNLVIQYCPLPQVFVNIWEEASVKFALSFLARQHVGCQYVMNLILLLPYHNFVSIYEEELELRLLARKDVGCKFPGVR